MVGKKVKKLMKEEKIVKVLVEATTFCTGGRSVVNRAQKGLASGTGESANVVPGDPRFIPTLSQGGR